MDPQISIITISFNNKVGLEKTIQSVINQSYKNIEYIIIDGNSSDGSINSIEKFDSKITYWISENDGGISDAFNKGIAQSHGEWLIFMNSGDVFYSLEILEDVVRSGVLDLNKSLLFYGKIILLNDRNQQFTFGDTFNIKEFEKRMTICHQSAFFHIEYFNKYGLFDNKFKLAMDYELLLRPNKFDYIFFDKIISIMETGGVSQKNTINVFKEYLIAKLLHSNKSIFRINLEYFYSVCIYKILILFRKWKL